MLSSAAKILFILGCLILCINSSSISLKRGPYRYPGAPLLFPHNYFNPIYFNKPLIKPLYILNAPKNSPLLQNDNFNPPNPELNALRISPPVIFNPLILKQNNFVPINPYSCNGRCSSGFISRRPCQCNVKCKIFGDCCEDYFDTCGGSCKNRCGTKYDADFPCHCNKKCAEYENCCSDIDRFCPRRKVSLLDDLSCEGRCNITGTDPTKPCQCNKPCVDFGDCCADYSSLCLGVSNSCAGRCGSGTDPSKPCQCNLPCKTFGDCCPDYDEVCEGGTQPGTITDAELAALSEEILSLDVNNVAQYVAVNLQGSTPSGGPDNAPNPLLLLDPQMYNNPIISLLSSLHDNYEASVSSPEVVTPEELEEETKFLDAILATPIMVKTAQFMSDKNIIPIASFRETFYKLWFGLYSRSGSVLGSSGFEHSFLGEIKSGVSGFHNWLFFGKEEEAGRLNYKGWIAQLDLGDKGMIVSHSFTWLNNNKPISSMFIGTSPELELALYTVCWYARPNAKCPIVLNGSKLAIQTYDISYGGAKYVGSAYPDV